MTDTLRLTPEDVQEGKRLSSDATPGPWTIPDDSLHDRCLWWGNADNGTEEIVKDKPVAALMRMRELIEAALVDQQPKGVV